MRNTSAILQIAAIWLVANVGNSIYFAHGVTPSPRFLLLYWLGTAWGFAAWISADRARLHLVSAIDFGWFAFAFWPVVVPYHLIQSRGLGRGVLAVLGFVALFACCYAIGLIAFAVASRW